MPTRIGTLFVAFRAIDRFFAAAAEAGLQADRLAATLLVWREIERRRLASVLRAVLAMRLAQRATERVTPTTAE